MRTPLARVLARLCLTVLIVTGSAVGLAGCGGTDSPSAAVDSAVTGTAPAAAGKDLALFIKDIGAELNEFWSQMDDDTTWSPAIVKVPETSATTACGVIDADNTGPAYCSTDSTMVLPVRFFREKLVQADDQGTNDAAVAAVVAHEFGHHLQSIIGVSDATAEAAAAAPEIANLISAADELSADCLMGTWLASVNAEGRLEVGDIQEVLNTLARMGDDRLTADAGAVADASTFDHGTAAERTKWFEKGYSSDDPGVCANVYDQVTDGTLAAALQAGADAVNGATTAP